MMQGRKKRKNVLPRRKTNEDRNDDSGVEKLKEAEQKKCDNESEGYTQLDSQGTVRSCSTITLLKGPHRNIIVNTGNPWERDLLLKALSDEGLKPEDIHYVICLNGHIEQIGNLNLFSGAVQCVGYDICRHDQYLLHELKEGMPFNIDEDVEIWPTPGHTGNDVSVVVKKANLGVLAGVG
ncbi:metallo-beta-lactamase domain-containing protein 1-like [Biomphalaria glabrata]|uniref:Metallo-beta-lactamase domain-containing protein 1 n=1 Tax=Biomphalaria glabrata TaxID=6526 RepID=A0A9W2ZGC0_BIOGL|nr:metallo-beta-lactamase domain-containing protein 1-like [Biomphalaria glabrata]